MDIQGILGMDSDIRNGYDDIKVTFNIDADAPQADIEALVAQSQKRSAVYDVITNPTNVNPIVNVFRGEQFAAKRKEYFEGAPAKIEQLDRACAGPFFLGEEPAYCDLALFHVLDNTRTLEPTALDEHPKLQAFMERVAALPGIAEYLDQRPDVVGIGTAPSLQPKSPDAKRQRVN